MKAKCLPAGCVALAVVASPTAAADTLTYYAGQGISSDLRQIPGRLLRNELEYEESYFHALGYRKPLPAPDPLRAVVRPFGLEPRAGAEFIIVKHQGLQNNWEVDGAYTIGTPPGELGPIAVRFNFGLGLSYAFGTPSYEDGPIDDPERRYRFQNYNSYELEWQHRRMPRVRCVTRIHHRSGIYGLIAPRRVGSNFMTLGLRFDLPE